MSSIRETMVMGFFLTVVVAIIITALLIVSGMGEVRGMSEYSGTVVDVEQDRGLVMRTSQIHMKTHPRASSSEVFCVMDGDEYHAEKALTSLQNGSRVTVKYSRPFYVSPFDCEPNTSILHSITVENDSSA